MTSVDRPPGGKQRVESVDAYRGFVMFLMLAEVLHLHVAARQFPDSSFWHWLSFHTTHVNWRGGSLHDLIQPSFCFLVGIALPFSLASRLGRGQSFGRMILHAAWRSFVLIVLGVLLHSIGQPRTSFVFTDTLTLIGLGYFPLFLLGLCAPRWQWLALGLILFGCWMVFVMYPVPGTDFDYGSVGVPADWPHHANGLAAHWNKNSNLGWAFDTWWMNLFPRDTPFKFNPGGYTTLNFIPTLGTMILGLIAGNWLRDSTSPQAKLRRFVLFGLSCLIAGLLLDLVGVCPSVKRIWTPTWVLVSGGWCCLLLAGFYCAIDLLHWRSWSHPLRVFGANAIVAYVMAHSLEPFVVSTLHTHFGSASFRTLGDQFEPTLIGCAVLLVYCLILLWLYRQKVFIKI